MRNAMTRSVLLDSIAPAFTPRSSSLSPRNIAQIVLL